MTPRFAADVPPRNPIARSLALAVLSLALVTAVIMGAVVFAALLGVFVIGYAVSFVHAWWRLARLRRRAAYIDEPQPVAPSPEIVEADFEVVEVVGDAARRGTGGPA